MAHFSNVKKLLYDIKAVFVTSPARRSRYLTFLKNHGILSPRKIPLPVVTRWNTWFEMIFYTLEHLFLLHDFFKKEFEDNSIDSTTIEKVLTTLDNSNELGLIHTYLHFISIYAREFVQDLEFFQSQNKPLFPFVYARLKQLSTKSKFRIFFFRIRCYYSQIQWRSIEFLPYIP